MMIKIITNSTIKSIINGNPDGLEKNYLISKDKSRMNRMIYIVNELKKNLNKPLSIEAKYKYGFRNVRIEIAFFDETLFLLKIVSDFRKIDKEAIKLDSIITKIKNEYKSLKVIGCMVLECRYDENVISNIKKILNNNFSFIELREIETNGADAIRSGTN